MTKQEASPSRGARRARGKGGRFALDPFFACLIFAGVGLGTLALGASIRLVILWAVLLVLWLVLHEGKSRRIAYGYPQIGRGALFGLVVGLPLALLALRALATAVPILFVGGEPVETAQVGSATVLVTLVFLAPLTEELFFRDLLQQKLGIWTSVGLYAAAGLLLFLPTAGGYPVVLISVVGAWAALGVMYAFCYERFGFATTLTCHALTNLFLLFLPVLLHNLGVWAQ
ncbi:MAG: CPBP family intramembrane metalloprotease [Anaerolineae bacterium]|nr:CPBP family intramembrane metalloprotease [Anaerolineae bacterium]